MAWRRFAPPTPKSRAIQPQRMTDCASCACGAGSALGPKFPDELPSALELELLRSRRPRARSCRCLHLQQDLLTIKQVAAGGREQPGGRSLRGAGLADAPPELFFLCLFSMPRRTGFQAAHVGTPPSCPELAVVGSKLQVLPAHCRRHNQLLQALALGGSERKVPVAAGEGRTVGGSALTSAPSLTVGSRRRGLRAAMCDESRSCAREEAQKPMLLNPTWPSTVCKRHAVLLARRLLTTALCTLMPAPAPQRRAQKARAHAPGRTWPGVPAVVGHN